MRWTRCLRQALVFGLAVAHTAAADTILAPWATPAQGWLATITSIWVPIIFTLLTVAVLVTSRYMGDRDDWISGLLNVMVKASLAANAFAIVGFFIGAAAGPGAAATLDEITTVLEHW